MEDPSMDWKTQDYSPLQESSKVCWVLKKGLGLGKKLVVAGIAISSAPLVLPPLLVFSGLGLAFSVPSGFFLVSYACTEKLMSKLLSTTPSPPLPVLEYGTMSSDEGEISNEAEEDVGFGGEIYFEDEERELMKDTMGGVEIGMDDADYGYDGLDQEGKLIEEYDGHGAVDVKEQEQVEDVNYIVEEEGYEEDDEEYAYGQGAVEMEEQEPVENVKEIVEEKGYEEDEEYVFGQGAVDMKEQEPVEDVNEIVEEEGYQEDDEDLADQNKHPLEEIDISIVGLREEEDIGSIEERTKPMMEGNRDRESVDEVHGVVIVIEGDEENSSNVEVGEPFGVIRGVDEISNVEKRSDIEDEEKLMRDTRSLLERIRDEDFIENSVENEEQRIKDTHGATEERGKTNVSDVEKMERPFGDRNAIDTLWLEKPILNMEEAVEKKNEIPNKYAETRERRYEGSNGTIPKGVKPVEEIEGILKRNMDEKHVDTIVEVEMPQEETREIINVGATVEKEQKPRLEKKAMLEARTEDNIVKDLDKSFQLERVFSDADAREIADESGFDLFDEKNAADEHYSYSIRRAEGIEQRPSYKNKKRAAVVDHHALSKVPDSPSKKATATHSDEALYSEHKIWEHIGALRTIIGYKAAPQATCMEELNALYIFAGVEPPVSYKDPSDIVEINDKLRFFMSIVGVK